MKQYSLLFIIFIFASILSLFIGSTGIEFSLFSAAGKLKEIYEIIFWQIRFPRTILSFLTGGCLALAGLVLQTWLRNPLADAHIFGISGFSAFGSVLALYLGLYSISPLFVPALGLGGAFISILLIMIFSHRNMTQEKIILLGIALSSLAGAGIGLLLNLANDPHMALEITFWLMGSVSEKSFSDIAFLSPFLFIGLFLLIKIRYDLNALVMGDEMAYSLGVCLKQISFIILLIVACLVGSITSLTGAIGFVGLAVPHIIRFFYGSLPSRLLIPSFLLGGVFVMIADIIVRILPTSSEIKLGLTTSLLGLPFLFHILFSSYKRKSI